MITDLRSKLDRLASEKPKAQVKAKHDISSALGAELVEGANGGYILRRVRYAYGAIYGEYTVENIEKAFDLEEKLLFLDTETTGLGSVACPFLIGLAYFTNEHLVLEQYFMRDVDDESAVLDDIVSKFSGMTVVSYNGKSFDVPLIKARCTINAINYGKFAQKQTDLLHLSRRIWKKRLENCKLTTIEEEILRLTREDDIPGSVIPEMYKRYLDTGRSDEMQQVIEHNESDVVSMSVLLGKLIRIEEDPCGQLDNIADVMHLGEYYYGKGDCQRANTCFARVLRASKNPLEQYNAMKYLSFIHKKNKNYTDAVLLWQRMDRLSLGAVLPLVELAKYYEHTEKNIPKAMECSRRGLANARASGSKDMIKELEIRIQRLDRKMRKV